MPSWRSRRPVRMSNTSSSGDSSAWPTPTPSKTICLNRLSMSVAGLTFRRLRWNGRRPRMVRPGSPHSAASGGSEPMYSFEPTEEQRMLIDAVQRYALTEVRTAAHDADESGELPQGLIDKGWDLGVLQASIPESYGGLGEHSAITGGLAAEELGCGDLAAGLAVMAPALYAIPLLLAGTGEPTPSLLPPVAHGAVKT